MITTTNVVIYFVISMLVGLFVPSVMIWLAEGISAIVH
jgi:hypothetical protein